ncbi:MAG: class I SAM-dependent methyltransferase [Candidatus Izemoplasma sp.]
MEIFDKEAKVYESWYKTTLGSVVLDYESTLLKRMIGKVANKTILDVGCATGVHTRLFANEDNIVTGIDISKEMITEAKKRRIDDISFLQMDATKMDFPDNSFDIVFSVTMIEFVTDKKKLINELFRVLKPGGYLFIGTIQKNSHFYDLYKTDFFKNNTVFKYAEFLERKDLIELKTDLFIKTDECLFNSIEDLELNPNINDIKNNKVGSFILAKYRK